MSLGVPKKLVIIGDFAVGKTTLLRKYLGSEASISSQATLGADIVNCQLAIEGSEDQIHCQMWDLSGQSAFAKMRGAFLTKADGAIILFDVTRSSTFINVEKWGRELANILGRKKLPVLIVGNKDDLRGEDSVSAEEASKIAGILRDNYLFTVGSVITSALTGNGVQTAFELLSSLIVTVSLAERS